MEIVLGAVTEIFEVLHVEVVDSEPYAQIFVMNADGTRVRQLTDSRWEDSMPVYVPGAQPTR